MDDFFDRLIVCAATIDELLSDAFVPIPGQKGDTELATRRLAAWCRSCASGDWSLFNQRLERDGLSFAEVLARFATVRRAPSAPAPTWIVDAISIDVALRNPRTDIPVLAQRRQPVAFEHLLAPVVVHADDVMRSEIDERAFANLSPLAHADLCQMLLSQLSDVLSEALYDSFSKARKIAPIDSEDASGLGPTLHYDRFVIDMKGGGFRHMFEEMPVLLRIVSLVMRQWIETTREFVLRLHADIPMIYREILNNNAACLVEEVMSDLSDPHNGGHSVLIVRFEDGSRVVYKPKDLRPDVAWHAFIEQLNLSRAPIDLKAVRAVARDGYGWTEFIDHSSCTNELAVKRYFRRAGAWLALFHLFAASDMHEENLIAAGEYPVPIDIEVILQAAATEYKTGVSEAEAFETAVDIVDNSVMMVGLLPTYSRSPDNEIFAMGGMISDWNSSIHLSWCSINTDNMRPGNRKEIGASTPNLPNIDGHYAEFGDNLSDFVLGFQEYANFLISQTGTSNHGEWFDGFCKVPVRKIIRPTSFYHLMLDRLKDHRQMNDGAIWSAQADFVARLSDWERNSDPLWPLQAAERAALLALNVPFFSALSDGEEIFDASGISIPIGGKTGIRRARSRVQHFCQSDIMWQTEIIRQNTASLFRSKESSAVARSTKRIFRTTEPIVPKPEMFLEEADKIVADLLHYAIRRGNSAAWISFGGIGDSEMVQAMPLGATLYNGVSGIAIFLAAHSAVTGSEMSKELALAAVAHLRQNLNGRNSARMARSLGTGVADGMGSIVYALAVMAKCLKDDVILNDARVAARLFSDDLIAADQRLDVFGGNAGGILGLLRLHRDDSGTDALERAVKCGNHLLAQPRKGGNGGSWLGQGSGMHALNGMSHGAAGFAYALASLAAVSEREEFANAAAQCIAFENASYDELHNNWPHFGANEGLHWPCNWCYGATGVGIARAAMAKRSGFISDLIAIDVRRALAIVERSWPDNVDTLCCGTLGSIEFMCEAAAISGQDDLRALAAQRMATVISDAGVNGDYRWDVGTGQFNLGLFRGLAGVGYTALRRVDPTLPNILILE